MTGAGKTVTYNPEDTSAKSIELTAGTNVSITDNNSTANALKLKISSSYTDTKNTAGSTNSASKLFIVGATTQAANPQTYSNAAVFEQAGTLTATSYNVGGDSGTNFYNIWTENGCLCFGCPDQG